MSVPFLPRIEENAMLINLIVLSITVLTFAFVLVWLRRPDLRTSIEAPKYDVAKWDTAPVEGD
jgi:hypothetical protein